MTINNIKGFILANKIDKELIKNCLNSLKKKCSSKTAYQTRKSVL